jgi:threonine aldolase
VTQRYDFASDNTAGFCPEALAALNDANRGETSSYGDDDCTKRLTAKVREIFETECDVHLVFNGTAANALSLAQLCQPFHSVICHEHAHIDNDECGAVEAFSGGAKLIPTRGANGKIALREVEAALARQRPLHSHKPRVLSITNATELGTVYRPEELRVLGDFAKSRGLLLQMDGARFANAAATLGCPPADISWRAGVDVLSFGGTKNGLAAGELVVFFNRDLAQDFDYRLKQRGQLASKMRFMSAPWLALLSNDVWLKNARHANAMAAQLERGLRERGCNIVVPREANAVFVAMKNDVAAATQARGWHFYKFIEPDVYRVMCSWATRPEAIEEFLRAFGGEP